MSGPLIPHLGGDFFLPRELGQLFARIQDELDAGDVSNFPLPALLSLLDDTDIQRAAELWGLIDRAGYVEVSIGTGHTRALRPPAIVHRVKDLRPGLAVEREGLRITDPVRTGSSPSSSERS